MTFILIGWWLLIYAIGLCIFGVLNTLSFLKVIRTDARRSAAYDFSSEIHSDHGPILYHIRDKWRFQSKIAKKNVHISVYLTSHLRRLLLEFCYGGRVRKNHSKYHYHTVKKYDDVHSFSHSGIGRLGRRNW